jgi:hypothetical protein
MLAPFDSLMECGGKFVYAGATVAGDISFADELGKGVVAGVRGIAAVREAFDLAIANITGHNAAMEASRNAAVATAVVGKEEALGAAHNIARSFLKKDGPLAAGGSAADGDFNPWDYVPVVGGIRGAMAAQESCSHVRWR